MNIWIASYMIYCCGTLLTCASIFFFTIRLVTRIGPPRYPPWRDYLRMCFASALMWPILPFMYTYYILVVRKRK